MRWNLAVVHFLVALSLTVFTNSPTFGEEIDFSAEADCKQRFLTTFSKDIQKTNEFVLSGEIVDGECDLRLFILIAQENLGQPDSVSVMVSVPCEIGASLKTNTSFTQKDELCEGYDLFQYSNSSLELGKHVQKLEKISIRSLVATELQLHGVFYDVRMWGAHSEVSFRFASSPDKARLSGNLEHWLHELRNRLGITCSKIEPQ